tara:strand:+ start:63 stop:260 length:198 start_codon:yes stop_codon:yes gene_type:complete
MKLGKASLIYFLFFINFFSLLNAEEKITTIPLVNLENLKPSFEKEESEAKSLSEIENISLKEKKN